MPDAIFISHATKDDNLITCLHDELEAATGRAIWVDHHDIAEGENWELAISTALRDCPYLIVALSRTSVHSVEVMAEWRAALLYKHRVLPVIIDDVPVEDIPPRLRLLQWVNLHTDWTGGVARLTVAITGRTDGITDVPDFAVPLHLTGSIPRDLSATPLRGRDKDVETLVDALKAAPGTPVVIIGPGGLGKSRLAAEVVQQHPAIRGVIWHRVSEFSRAYDLYPLVNHHFRLPDTTEPREALAKLRSEPTLVVLDNAEDAPPTDAERHHAYVTLVNDLLANGAQVLLTSRVEWRKLRPVQHYEPTQLDPDSARQFVLDIADQEGIPNLEPDAADFARAALEHPRLMQWAVQLLTELPRREVLRDLQTRSSSDAQEAMNEMIGKTVQRMVSGTTNGAQAEAVLRRLVVCRGGFTFTAAQAISGLDDADALRAALRTLQTWRFVRFDPATERFDLPLIVIAGVPPDPDAHRLHYDYYLALAKVHDKKQDYQGLNPESANLEAAFEWAMDTGAVEDAYWLSNACDFFLANRGRFVQRLDWIQRVAARIIPTDRPDDAPPGDGPGRTAVRPYGDRVIAAVQVSLGNVYQQHPLGSRRDNLRRAIEAYEAALVYWTADAAPLDYAMTQNNLGTAYADLAEIEDRAGNLQRAIAAFEATLVHYTADAAPLDYATTQNNLGAAYADLAGIAASSDDRSGNLRRAIAAYEAALVYRTADAAPLDYALTQNNLGNAYADLAGIEDRAGNLRRAIAAYEAALVYWTADAAPLDYATTQNNLGNAYRNLAGIEDRAGNLRRALAAFEAALVYLTADAAPLHYATTQNNLGIAYQNLAGIEDRAGNLRRALAAYEAALVYLTADAAPLSYAATQRNMGIAQEDLGDLPAAITCWREAEQYYRQMDMIEDADLMLTWIVDAEARLSGDDPANGDEV